MKSTNVNGTKPIACVLLLVFLQMYKKLRTFRFCAAIMSPGCPPPAVPAVCCPQYPPLPAALCPPRPVVLCPPRPAALRLRYPPSPVACGSPSVALSPPRPDALRLRYPLSASCLRLPSACYPLCPLLPAVLCPPRPAALRLGYPSSARCQLCLLLPATRRGTLSSGAPWTRRRPKKSRPGSGRLGQGAICTLPYFLAAFLSAA